MRIQLTRSGTVVDATEAEFAALRTEFDRAHCVVLPRLIEPALLEQIQLHIEAATFFEKTNKNVGDELRIRPHPVNRALQFLCNDSAFFAAAERITGCPPIGCYQARVYRLMPNTGHASDWHEDMVQDRMLTMSVNLSPQPFEGGVLQIRDVETHALFAEVANTGAGDAVLFRIAATLQHRVTATTGTMPRTAYAGWFLRQPNFSEELQRQLNAAALRRNDQAWSKSSTG